MLLISHSSFNSLAVATASKNENVRGLGLAKRSSSLGFGGSGRSQRPALMSLEGCSLIKQQLDKPQQSLSPSLFVLHLLAAASESGRSIRCVATRAGAIYARQHMNFSGGNVTLNKSLAWKNGGRASGSLSWSWNMGRGISPKCGTHSEQFLAAGSFEAKGED